MATEDQETRLQRIVNRMASKPKIQIVPQEMEIGEKIDSDSVKIKVPVYVNGKVFDYIKGKLNIRTNIFHEDIHKSGLCFLEALYLEGYDDCDIANTIEER